MIPGYKPFFETLPPATPATLLPSDSGNHTNNEKTPENNTHGSNGSRGSSTPRFEKTHDTDNLIERSAIREYDAGFPRDDANMAASRAYDRQRQSYEFAHPGRDTAIVEQLYVAYIQDWQPDGPDDLPATPPNTNGNGNLWRQWWRRVEEVHHAG